MKKGVEYTGTVVGLSFPNKGKVDCGEDGTAAVKGTIPGQTPHPHRGGAWIAAASWQLL